MSNRPVYIQINKICQTDLLIIIQINKFETDLLMISALSNLQVAVTERGISGASRYNIISLSNLGLRGRALSELTLAVTARSSLWA